MKMKQWLTVLLAFGVLTLCLMMMPATEAASSGWRDISTQELKTMLDRGQNLCLINVLPRIIHDAEHIKGSINIPIGKIKTSPEMPRDKDKPIVFYCLGRG